MEYNEVTNPKVHYLKLTVPYFHKKITEREILRVSVNNVITSD